MGRSRAFFDTNVLVSAFLYGGKPQRCLDAAASGHIVLVSSVHVITELVDVLGRPRLRADADDVAVFLEDLTKLADVVPVGVVGEPIGCRDSDDEPVLLAALLGRVDMIVTGDRGLLDLADPPVPILTVDEALSQLG